MIGLAIGGATALGAYGVYEASQGGLNEEGGIPVDNGVLRMDDPQIRALAEENHITGLDQRNYEVGSYGAINAWYLVCVAYTETLTKWTRLAEEYLSPEELSQVYRKFVTTGEYSVRWLTGAPLRVVESMVNCALSLGICLRILGMLYDLANVHDMYRPAAARRMGVDLATIRFGSALNPLSHHMTDRGRWDYATRRVLRPSGWIALGWEIETSWLEAYSELAAIPGALNTELVEEMHHEFGAVEEGSVTMGAMGAFPWVGVLIVLAIAGGAYYVFRETTAYVAAALSVNREYQEASADAYREALDCWRDEEKSPEERERCREQAEWLAEQIRTYKPPWADTATAIAYGAIGLTGLGLYFWYRRGK